MSGVRVWVIDSSALIDAKSEVAAQDQWALFRQLETMVDAGELFFPRQVTRELHQNRHVDIPEGWVLSVCDRVRAAYDPEDSFVQQVMRVAGEVVDADGEEDQGDPYVLAQTLEICSQGLDACVVTNDVVDRLPLKLSMKTACRRLDLPMIELSEFLPEIGFGQ